MAWMFSPNSQHTTRTPKLHLSSGLLPPFIDPQQPPNKKSPWRQIGALRFIKSVTLLLPLELYGQIAHPLSKAIQISASATGPSASPEETQAKYSKVILSLSDILSSDFYNAYIRAPSSNILLLSEGTPGVDNIYTLCDGTLELDLSKESYQKAGLQGEPIKTSGGRKHVKERYMVRIDLRTPAMVRGRKGFDRLARAAREVLVESKVWLFRDLSKHSRSLPQDQEGDKIREAQIANEPLLKHHPTTIRLLPVETESYGIAVPALLSYNHLSQPQYQSPNNDHTLNPSPAQIQHRPHQKYAQLPFSHHEEDYYEIIEWLDLVSLKSPRVRVDNDADPYICRYKVPTSLPSDLHQNCNLQSCSNGIESQQQDTQEVPESSPEDIKILKWIGLLDSTWLTNLLIQLIKTTRSQNTNTNTNANTSQWLAISVTTHKTEAVGSTDGLVILLQPRPRSLALSSTNALDHDPDPDESDNPAANNNMETPPTRDTDVDVDVDVDVDMDMDMDVNVNVNAENPPSSSSSSSSSKDRGGTRDKKGGFQTFFTFELVDS